MRPVLLWFIALAAASGPASADELTPREQADARNIYVAKCAKCHRFYEPTNYAEPDWQTWMDKMDKKSKLKPDQARLLKRYLDSYRAGQLARKPEAKEKSR